MSKQTEKRIIRENVGYKEWDADSDIKNEKQPLIDEVIGWLQAMKQKGAHYVDFHAYCYDGDSSNVEMTGFFLRTETDKEAAERLRKEEQSMAFNKQMQEKYEREEYERLKAKFESKP
jgi:hypothetical protein